MTARDDYPALAHLTEAADALNEIDELRAERDWLQRWKDGLIYRYQEPERL